MNIANKICFSTIPNRIFLYKIIVRPRRLSQGRVITQSSSYVPNDGETSGILEKITYQVRFCNMLFANDLWDLIEN